MKAFLMYPGQDFDLDRDPPTGAADLIQDLELGTLFGAMAAGDQFLYDVASRAVLGSLTDPPTIVYRQHVLADCLRQPAAIRKIYDIAVGRSRGRKRSTSACSGRRQMRCCIAACGCWNCSWASSGS